MSKLFQILPEIALLVGVFGAMLFVILVFRDPTRPTWLRWNWVAVAASIAIAAAFTVALGTMIAASVSAGFGVGSAILLTVAIAGAAGYAMVRGFNLGERLRRCDAGQSPFSSPAGIEVPKPAGQPPFKGPAGA